MTDPRRLLSQTGTEEALLLGAVRAADPPPAAKDEVWRRIGLAAGAGIAVAATPIVAEVAGSTVAKAAAHAGWLSAVKWVVVVAALAPAAGVTARWLVTSRASVMSSRAIAPSSSPAAASVAGPDTAAGVVEAAPDNPPAVAVAPPGLPERAAGVRGAFPAAPRSAAPSSLDAENGLLRRARARLEGGDANGALADVAALASRFPHGALAQEREVVAIQALLAQRQRSTAATRTADFLRVYPGSPYADALRRALDP